MMFATGYVNVNGVKMLCCAVIKAIELRCNVLYYSYCSWTWPPSRPADFSGRLSREILQNVSGTTRVCISLTFQIINDAMVLSIVTVTIYHIFIIRLQLL